MPESIAIISTACRFPGGSNSPAKLWELLKEPRDILKPIDESRLRLSKFHHSNGEHHGSTDVQVVYEAFEAAGYSLDQMQGSQTSVHVGVMNGDYYDLQMRDPETLPTHTATGTARSILSNRISYTFDLKGASMTIDTACSSSLVALHQAVQGLRNGEATMAVVGGANLLLDPLMYIAESNLHMLSSDSRCKMWDKSANGYARGEGFAAVLLKPLKDAIRDGDHIEGVIRETAVNSDGRTKGITMPSPTAQAAMIRQAYKNAGLDPTVDRCQYFECHGTGTQAGDPVEAQAIRDAFFPLGSDITDDTKLYVGSIKTIIGHLEGCAGLAGLIKALLAMKHHTIPPNLHFKELSSKVEPFYHNLQIPTKAIPWPETNDKCLRASVNSFGFGGTNAHVILESYEGEKPAPIQIPDDKFIGPLVLSASTGVSLIESVKSYADRIRSDPSLDLENLAWILQKKRSSLSSKIFFSGATRQRLIDFMDRFVEDSSSVPPETVGNQFHPIDPNETPGILGVFTGQGAQWASMGRGLYKSSHLFRSSIEQCEAVLNKLPDAPSWSLTEQLLADEGTSRISEAEISQPICTALQIALVDLLRASGVKLDAVVGHSSGEIAATYAAGIINLENAMQIAYYRGFHSHLAKKSVPGAMMAVGLSFADAYRFCNQPEYFGRLKVAASNSPLSVTLSGDADAIMQAKAHFDESKTFARQLKVDTAYHSHLMLPCAEAYLKSLLACDIQIQSPREDCIWTSSVRGDTDLLEDGLEPLKGQYWVDNLLGMVQFSQAVEHSIWHGGPFNGPAEQTLKTRGDDEVEAFSAFDRQTSSHLLKDLPSYVSHQELRWRNIVRLHELPWIQGHLFQGQVLFPGAGYIVMALQAGAEIADQRAVELYEVTDIHMDRAMVIPEGTAGKQSKLESNESLSFEFACYFCNDENNGQPVKAAYVPASNLVPIDMDRFYTSMTSGRRALGFSSTVSSWETENLKGNNYVMHPGFLDVALQTLYVSFASPASGEMEADSFGDIHVYPKGLEMKAVSEPQASNDKHLFSETDLDDIPLMEALDRTATFAWYLQLMTTAAEELIERAANGDHPVIKPEWLEDSAEVIEELNKTHGESVHLKLILQILEVMIADDMLNRFYAMKQITFKNPQAVVLEIGAGTGGTTRNISTGFFENAEERFRDHSGKMTQSFAENTYDVIIAANVFHATRTLGDTMRHVRMTGPELLRTHFIMGALSGWWLGGDDGRWDELLQETGFSGAQHSVSFVLSRATDSQDIQGEQPILIVDVQKSFLDDVPVSTLVPGTSVLFLGDLDKQSLFLTAKNVLWITEGRTAKNPEANMIVGLQFLDIDTDARSRDISKIITQTFLRLEVFLWQIEPELIYDGEKMLISRILPNKALNDRHNANRRPIKQTLDLQTAAVDIVQEGKSFVVVPSAPGEFTEDDKIQVKYSLSLYNDTQYPVFLNIGSNSHTGETVIILSTSCSSTFDAAHAISLGDVPCNAQVLESIACKILLDLIRSKIPAKGTVLFYEPPKALVHQLQSDADLKNKEFRFVSTGPKQASPGWIQLFPRASQTANRLLLPLDTSCVIKFQNASSFNLESILPPNISILGVSDVLHEFQSKLHKDLPSFLSDLHQSNSDLIHTQMMTVSSLLESSPESLPGFFIIDWSDSGLLKVALKPLDVSKAFSSNRTYLLVGMTKELGLSLAQWMVKNGARHLALTSRSGSVEDPGWVPAMKAHGANVQLFSMDVADLESVTGVVDTINKTMPPIAGVCNAAMVLSDGLFADMSFDVMQNTLKPKVDGSRNLDQVFYDIPLDFFVLFSSMASIIGNPGQSNYHAANLYMEGLCGQRRSRGLAASAMHIGMVADIGYVARRGQSMEDHLRKMFFLPLSESDVHQLFAESILASQDTVYGLEPFVDSPEAPKRPPWEGNPRFSHFMRKEASSNEVSKDRALDTDYKQRLQSDESEDSLIDMVQQIFGRKLEAMMQLSPNSINLNVPLIDLGVDSLLAVEIRSWFLKKLGMDVPVLKVLSGDTTAQLCEDATRRFLGLKLKQNSASKPEQQPEVLKITPKVPISETSSKFLSIETPALQASTASNSSGHEDDSAHSSGDSISVPDIHTPNEECSQDSFNSSSTNLVDYEAEVLEFGLNQTIKEAEIMSHAQSRLYVAQNYVNDPTTYNVTVTYQIRGNLQIPRFKQALNSVMTHHESLRTCFFKDENTGLLKQGVLPSPSYYLRIVQSKQDDAVDREIALFKEKHWDLEHGRTFGVSLIVQSPEVSTIIFGYHHLVMDGVSWHLFLRDLSIAYQLRPLVKASMAIENGDFAEDLRFWKKLHDQPAEPLQLLPITSVVARKPLTQYASHVQSRVIDTELVSRIKQASKALRVTPFHFHLSIVQLILSRFLALDDICIDFSETVGFFLNLLPLRFRVDQNSTFGQLASNTSRKALEGLAHSAVPFDVILDHLDVARSPAYSPLFQTSMGDCEIELTQVEDAKNPYDISFGVTEITSGTCLIELTCQNALYTVEDSQTLMDIYIHLLETLSSNTDIKVKDCPLFDRSDVSYDWPPTLSARFNEVQRADASYSQLSNEANGISQLILAQGGSPGAHIAVLCEPSAGCVYIPLDLSLPAARHISILNDSTKEAGTQLIAASQTKAQLLNVSGIKANDEPVSIQAQADTPAFILYTSGSTGKPKGVVLSQANFANHLAVKTQELLIEREVVLQQSSLGFDMSIIQTFVALANGGKLVIAPREKRGDPIALSELMQKEGVTFTIATPTEYLMLLRNGEEYLRKCTSWQQACMGGEVVSSQLLHQFRSSQVSVKQLTNCYGPTEITAAATFQDLSPALTDGSFQVTEGLIGKVLPNYSVKILDSSGEAVPLGVASGYLHLPELTAEKFALDSNSTQKDARMYRTGDKGRLRRDGSLEFLGRLDQDSQIKLRGLRIELGEIEHVLFQAGEGLFSDVVITVRGDPAVLVAYVVLNKDRTADRATLQAIISKLPLPQYMIPAAIQVLERLPTNASGKTDRKAVASLDFVLVTEGSHSNERLDLSEGELLLLWQKVLPNTNEPHILDRNSDFFLHGGNSLLLMKLQGAIKDSMDISVPISELYQVSTLGRMAAHLRNKRDELATEFEPIDWELETAIPEHILAISQDSQPSTPLSAGGHEIVLTGSTSFLGAAVLKALLKESTVKKVHCITVPSDQSSKLPVHPKVAHYQGTLLSPTLGLSETEHLKLQTSATCIIHAGANGHCLNNYSSLRVPNVHSTHFLASLALPRAIPIHFISSNRVALLSGSMQPAAESMSRFTPRTDGAEGFTVAKWASERFLESLAEKAHLPVTIHRHCILTGDEAPNEDAVNGVMKYSSLTRTVPLFANFDGFFDLKDVHAAAADIAANVLSEDSTDRSVRFIHHSSGVKVPISDFKKHLEKLYSGVFEEVTMDEWIGKVLEAGIDPLITSYLQAMAEKEEVIQFPFLGVS
ncbi:hybrid PKS-NRPS [Trichoderma sp. SZMC 28011]